MTSPSLVVKRVEDMDGDKSRCKYPMALERQRMRKPFEDTVRAQRVSQGFLREFLVSFALGRFIGAFVTVAPHEYPFHGEVTRLLQS